MSPCASGEPVTFQIHLGLFGRIDSWGIILDLLTFMGALPMISVEPKFHCWYFRRGELAKTLKCKN